MFKTLITLFRGQAHDRAEAFVDANALSILDQQLRDGAQSLAKAKKAVGLAVAQQKQELTQHESITSRMKDLEVRAVEAFGKGESELAEQAAAQIAIFEDELIASKQAQDAFSSDISKLRENVRQAEERLRALKRGQKVALANDQTQKLRGSAPQSVSATLGEAEATLEKLRMRQNEVDLSEDAINEMERENDSSALVKKLADAGCGKALGTRAEDVLERLIAKSEKSKLA